MFKRPSMHGWQCPIRNGTIKTFVLDSNVYDLQIIFEFEFVTKVTCGFLLKKKQKKLSELNSFKPRKTTMISAGFKDSVLNQELPSLDRGSLETTLTVPLKECPLLIGFPKKVDFTCPYFRFL